MLLQGGLTTLLYSLYILICPKKETHRHKHSHLDAFLLYLCFENTIIKIVTRVVGQLANLGEEGIWGAYSFMQFYSTELFLAAYFLIWHYSELFPMCLFTTNCVITRNKESVYRWLQGAALHLTARVALWTFKCTNIQFVFNSAESNR